MPIKHTKALTSVGIIGLILSIYEGMAEQPVWAEAVAHVNANAPEDSVEYATATATPAMKKWISGRNAKRIFGQSVTLVSEKYEATMQDDVDNFKFDKTGLLMRRLSAFAWRARSHWNKLATAALELGTSALTYDGLSFFNTAHTFGDSGTLNNDVTATEVPALNVTTTTAVTTAEAADIIYGLLNHFKTFKDDEGEPLHEDLMSLIIMVPVQMGGAFKQAAQAQIVTDGVGSRDNPLQADDVRIRIVVNARLTSSTVLYAFADNGDPALILQQKGTVEYTSKAEGSDFEHDNDMWEFGSKAHRVAGLFCWQAAIRATIS